VNPYEGRGTTRLGPSPDVDTGHEPRPGSTPARDGRPFLLLDKLYGDAAMAGIFSESSSIERWLQVERALAKAQLAHGVLSEREQREVESAARPANLDAEQLWADARNVGYPILPLVRQVSGRKHSSQTASQIHYGATTQDIMDTALALQLRDAMDRLDGLLQRYGDAVAELVVDHRDTIMAARTHGQQAVPTTFGAKMAVVLSEIDRHRTRASSVRSRVCLVSLYGGGGTSAALGPSAARVRESMAVALGLDWREVPWHVSRDGTTELGLLCASITASVARLAREVIDLSRTEIGEVSEADGHHRGASSTMPQKRNPVLSEAVIGFAGTSSALASGLLRTLEAGHERAAGEWQIEWQVLPQIICAAASALALGADIAGGMQVFPKVMRRNLNADAGLVMAEAYMMRLAPTLGRERAHDVVYTAARAARSADRPLPDLLNELLSDQADSSGSFDATPIAVESYLGHTRTTCDIAVFDWRGNAGLGKS